MEFAGEFYQTFQEEEIIPALHKDEVDSPIRNPLLLQLSACFSVPQTSSCSPLLAQVSLLYSLSIFLSVCMLPSARQKPYC